MVNRRAGAQVVHGRVHSGGDGAEGFGKVAKNIIAGLRRQLHKANQAIVAANKNSGVKELTIAQLNDLIIKSRNLKEDLGLKKQSGDLLKKSHV